MSRDTKLVLRIAAGAATVAVVGVFAVWFSLHAVVATYRITNAAMMPTLHPHDVVFADKFSYRTVGPKRGEIVVFAPPLPESGVFIKRVIAIPGDRVTLIHGILTINGKRVNEPYTAEKAEYDLRVADDTIEIDEGDGWHALDRSQANIPPKSAWRAPDEIPPHAYLVLGDNRNDSEDSHIFGFMQDEGTFASGPAAGARARFEARVTRIGAPAERARNL